MPEAPELFPASLSSYRCGAVAVSCIRYKVYGWDIQLHPTGEVDGFRQLLIMEIISTPTTVPTHLEVIPTYLALYPEP